MQAVRKYTHIIRFAIDVVSLRVGVPGGVLANHQTIYVKNKLLLPCSLYMVMGFTWLLQVMGEKEVGFSMKPRGCVVGQGFDNKNLLNPQVSLDRNPHL